MRKVMIVFAHPYYEKSRVHKNLMKAARGVPGITIRDLYELYPDFDVNIKEEQKLLTEHDVIIMQHPFYWYSIPALMKQWIDLVLEHGWAYGSEGKALRGKYMMNACTTGGGEQAYLAEGYNHYTMKQFLFPLERTAVLCGMNYLPPFVVHGTHKLEPQEITEKSEQYKAVLQYISDPSLMLPKYEELEYCNQIVERVGR